MCKTCGRSEDSAGVVKQLASEQWNRPERLASAHTQSRRYRRFSPAPRTSRCCAIREKPIFTGFDSAPRATRGVNGRKHTANCAYYYHRCQKRFYVIYSRYVFGRPFVKRFALYAIRPLSVLSVCLSVCPVCDVGVLWQNGWMDQDETWHAGRPRPWPHCVRWGSSFPPPKGHTPNFRPISVVAKWLDESRCHLVGR